MFNKRMLAVPNGTYLTQKINKFSGVDASVSEGVLSGDNCVSMYNFNIDNGTLKKSHGFSSNILSSLSNNEVASVTSTLNSWTNILGVWHYKKIDIDGNQIDFIIVLLEDFSVYSLNLSQATATWQELNLTLTSVPIAVNYNLEGEDVIIFCSKTDNMQVWNGEVLPYSVADAPRFVDICIHEERLFALTDDTKTLWFSDDLNPTSWNISLEDAGFIQMTDSRGALRKVISWNGYVYIFRDYGISRLSATGFQETFSLSHLFTSSSKIYAQTVCVCGDRVLFMASDGLYAFDGVNTTPVLTKLSPILIKIANSNAIGAFCDGKYFLSCNSKFVDDRFSLISTTASSVNNQHNSCIIIDAQNFAYEICRGIDIDKFCVFNFENESHLICLSKKVGAINNNNILRVLDSSGKIDSDFMKCVWISVYNTLGKSNVQKCIREITTNSNKSFSLYLKTENGEVELIVPSANGIVHTKCLLCGKKFCFAVVCDADNTDFEIGEIAFKFTCA